MESDPRERSSGTRQIVRLGAIASRAFETVFQLVKNHDLLFAKEEIIRLIAARYTDMGRAFQREKTTALSHAPRTVEAERFARQKVATSYHSLLIGLLRWNAPDIFLHTLQELSKAPPFQQRGGSSLSTASSDNALFYLYALLQAYAGEGRKSVEDCFPPVVGALQNDLLVHQRSYARTFYGALIAATESGDLGYGKIAAIRWGSNEPIKTVELEIIVTLRFAGPARDIVQSIIDRFGKGKTPEQALTAFILWGGEAIKKQKKGCDDDEPH